MHKNHICALFGHVRAGAYRQANIGSRQGGGVVDAVSHHRHALAGVLQLAHQTLLVCGQDVRDNPRHAYAFCDRLRGQRVVAGEHNGLDAQAIQGGDGLSAGGLDLVRNRDGSNKVSVLGKEQRRLALVGKALSHGLVDLYAKIGHKVVVAGGDLVGALARGHAAAGQRLEVLHAAGDYAHLVRAGHDGFCQRVLAALLECGGELHQRLLAHDGRAVRAGGGQDIGHAGSSRGDGAGLVQHHGANAAQVLKRLGVLE